MALQRQGKILLFTGKGNNGGDGYVAGRYLLKKGYEVEAFQLFPLGESTPLCQKQASRFAALGAPIHRLEEGSFSANFSFFSAALLIDAIFGTGFKGELPEKTAQVVEAANNSGIPIIAIDIPSGLTEEENDGGNSAIKAIKTLFLGLPKQSYFLGNGLEYVGALQEIDFGLSKKYIEEEKTALTLITFDQLKFLLPKIVRRRHKYDIGPVLAIAGSKYMSGAAILSTKAALRAGAGIVKLAHHQEFSAPLAPFAPEVIHLAYEEKNKIVLEELKRCKALYIGPGIGLTEASTSLIKEIWEKIASPCVIDADALTLLAAISPPLWPEGAVLTPHYGELTRLLNCQPIKEVDLPLLFRCQRFVEEKKITLVIKGAPTFILHPFLPIHVSIFGDPGMATAGSGDVLTGIIASFLAQGVKPHSAACLGVAVHGIAGELAAAELTSYGLISSDIIAKIPAALKQIIK